jgi:hypothetical protein
MTGPTDPITAGIATVMGTALGTLASIDWGAVVAIVGVSGYVAWVAYTADRQRPEMIDELREIAGKLEQIVDKLNKLERLTST